MTTLFNTQITNAEGETISSHFYTNKKAAFNDTVYRAIQAGILPSHSAQADDKEDTKSGIKYFGSYSALTARMSKGHNLYTMLLPFGAKIEFIKLSTTTPTYPQEYDFSQGMANAMESVFDKDCAIEDEKQAARNKLRDELMSKGMEQGDLLEEMIGRLL